MAIRSLITGLLLGASVLAFGTGCGDKDTGAEIIDGKRRDAWERDLDDADTTVQAAALLALAKAKDPPLDRIASYLNRKGKTVLLAAVQALGVAGPVAAKYAEDLAIFLEEDPPGYKPEAARELRNAAMQSIGKMGKEAFKPIAHLLVSRNPLHRLRAVYTLRPFVHELEDGVNTLLPLISDKDANVRREAAMGLGKVGKGDARASTALVKALTDDDPRVVEAAAVAVGGLGGRSDVEGDALAKLLYAHQTGIRTAAVYGLGLMGEEASPYIDDVADLLANDSQRSVRIQAARAHFRISGDASKALPQLEMDVDCESVRECREAIRAIGEIGQKVGRSVNILASLLERPDVRGYAARALGDIGPAASEALPELEKAAAASAEDGEVMAIIDEARRKILGG